ncbi:MAG: Rid family detoxifying hydrolase [Clostridia bacterium]|nr:Rid family detoxifying hydrolase [Clostridia bacterium]
MKEIITAANAPAAIGPYSHAVAIEGIVFTSGQIGFDPVTMQLAEGVEAQTVQALTNLTCVLEAAGATLADVVKTTVFVKDMSDFVKVNTIYAKFFTELHPARSCVQVAALPANALVEIEAIAFKGADEQVSN